MKNNRKLAAAWLIGAAACCAVTGCTMPWQKKSSSQTPTQLSADNAGEAAGTSLDLTFDEEDYITTWDENNSTLITLSGTTAGISGTGARVSGQTVEITQAGTYVLSGELTAGCIRVNCTGKGTVRLVLNGVTLTAADTAGIQVEDAKKVLVTLAEGTVNSVTDNSRGSTEAESYSAAVSSESDLVFNGAGTLNVNAGYRNGIKSSDDLKIVSGTFNITSVEDGIIGRDLLGIENGSFIIQAGTDGMKSTYDTDTEKGNIIITGGTYDITAGNDGVQAENTMLISGGSYHITTGGGAAAAATKTGDTGMMGNPFASSGTAAQTETDNDSCKGLKAGAGIYMTGGSYQLDCQDDAVHTNDTVQITAGTFEINTGDDGIHADSVLQIDGGTIDIQYCYEGLEAASITVNGGDISIMASDDGINAASGSTDTAPGMGGFNQGKVSEGSADIMLIINGGKIFVNAAGDGLDSNGTVTMNGGEVVVCGPTDNNNAALDFDGSFTVNGGMLMAFGSSGMLEIPTSASNGCCIATAFTSQSADTEFKLTASDGSILLAYTPVKAYASAVVYSADIEDGSTYTVTAGSVTQSVTVSGSVTASGVSGGMGGGFPGNQGNQGNQGDMQGGMPPDQQGGTPGGGRNAYR